MNIIAEYCRFRRLRRIFLVQHTLLLTFLITALVTLLAAIISIPVFVNLLSVNLMFISGISLISCIFYHGEFMSYRKYQKRKKKIYDYIEHLLDNRSESDDEILVLLTNSKTIRRKSGLKID